MAVSNINWMQRRIGTRALALQYGLEHSERLSLIQIVCALQVCGTKGDKPICSASAASIAKLSRIPVISALD